MLTVLRSEKPPSSSWCVFMAILRVGTNKLQTPLVEDNRFIDCSHSRQEAGVYTLQVAGPPDMLGVRGGHSSNLSLPFLSSSDSSWGGGDA